MSDDTDPAYERLVVEHRELCEKMEKLDAFLKKGKPSFVSQHQWNLMGHQLTAMEEYAEILSERITYWGE